LAGALVACSYFWLAKADGTPLLGAAGPRSHYQLLAEAFRRRQLHLPVEPHPSVLALADPYSVVVPQRLGDASLFKGKYYLYFGPTPVVALYLPVRLLLGRYPTDELAVALFSLAGVALWCALLTRIRAGYAPGLSGRLLFVAFLGVGFCNAAPYLLSRPLFYEVAISSASCFLAAFLLCLFLAVWDTSPQPKWLVASSLALGLTVGCRPYFVLLVPFLLIAGWWALGERRTPARRLASLGGHTAPLWIALAILGLYNYGRFGSFVEFGVKYQLAAVVQPKGLFDSQYLVANAWYYLFEPAGLSLVFPFVVALPTWRSFTPTTFQVESAAGTFVLYPVVWLVVAGPLLYKWRTRVPRALLALTGVFGLTALVALIVLDMFRGVTMRYTADFMPSLLATAILGGWGIHAGLASSRWRAAWEAILATLILVSAVSGILIGLGGHYGSFALRHPEADRVLRKASRPLEDLLTRGRYGGLRLVILPSAGSPGEIQSLVSTGVGAARNWLLMRYVTRAAVHFGCATQALAVFGDVALAIAPGQPIDVKVYMTSLYPPREEEFRKLFPRASFADVERRCLVRVRGQTIADIETSMFHPNPEGRVGILRSDLDANQPTTFRGRVVLVERIGTP
jgi:hypothetical protein